jgi:hypothetical protein
MRTRVSPNPTAAHPWLSQKRRHAGFAVKFAPWPPWQREIGLPDAHATKVLLEGLMRLAA